MCLFTQSFNDRSLCPWRTPQGNMGHEIVQLTCNAQCGARGPPLTGWRACPPNTLWNTNGSKAAVAFPPLTRSAGGFMFPPPISHFHSKYGNVQPAITAVPVTSVLPAAGSVAGLSGTLRRSWFIFKESAYYEVIKFNVQFGVTKVSVNQIIVS